MTKPPGRPQHATASHQSYRIHRADADPWANGDQRRVNDSRALGGTGNIAVAKIRRTPLRT
jgi:hypothetical protein